MEKLEKLYDMLCDELERLADEPLTAKNLEMIDDLAESMKNIDKIIDHKEMYSTRHDGGSYDGYTYARRRDARGRYMSGYSRDSLKDHLEHAMRDAKDERMKDDIRRLLDRM